MRAEDLAVTKSDDEYAQSIIDAQNILALWTAAMDYDRISACSVAKRSSASTRPAVGSKVTFIYRSESREGTAKATSPRDATLEFSDGGKLIERSIPLKDVEEITVDSASKEPEPEPFKKSDKVKQHVEMFNGERHRFPPSTTSIASVLAGLSSKNNDTARRMIQEIIREHGEEKFYDAVHVIVADQEFMPTMLNEFFSRLTSDSKLPIIPVLAIGHVMKGISVSMVSYYQ